MYQSDRIFCLAPFPVVFNETSCSWCSWVCLRLEAGELTLYGSGDKNGSITLHYLLHKDMTLEWTMMGQCFVLPYKESRQGCIRLAFLAVPPSARSSPRSAICSRDELQMVLHQGKMGYSLGILVFYLFGNPPIYHMKNKDEQLDEDFSLT